MWLRWLQARSIETRLFLSAAFWSLLILVIAAVILTTFYIHNSEAAFDKRLNVYLQALVADISSFAEEDPRSELGQIGDAQFLIPGSGWYWQITRTDVAGNEMRASRSLSASRLPRLATLGVEAGIGGVRSGYFTGPDARQLRMVERIISNGDAGVFLVQVAGNAEEVAQDVANFKLELGFIFLLLATAILASVGLQVRFGLAPLRSLQERISDIRRGEAEQVTGIISPDLVPLAEELNLLMVSNREIVDRARTHVGNLAHALKTPLSVIFNEARANGSAFAEKVDEQAGIMQTHVDIYLERARAAARAGNIGSSCDVQPALSALMRTFSKIYRDKDFEPRPMTEETIRFRGEKQDFDEMVGNLLDNAGKWSRHVVSVALEPDNDTHNAARHYFTLSIDDDGVGLTEVESIEAVKRGKRLDETVAGSGLGLSIVSDLAAAYGGSLKLLRSEAGGLSAKLRLPSY